MKKTELIQMHQLFMEIYKFMSVEFEEKGTDENQKIDNDFFDAYSQSNVKPTSVNRKREEHETMVRLLGHSLSAHIEGTSANEIITDPDTAIDPEGEIADLLRSLDEQEETTEDTTDQETDPTLEKINNASKDDVPDELLQNLKENNLTI
jgi:hypothetical protein